MNSLPNKPAVSMVHRLASGQRGFTLFEVIIAISIFAVVGVIANVGIKSFVDSQSALVAESERLNALRMGIATLERDIRQAVPRAVRDGYGAELQPMLGGGVSLTLTRGGWSNPLGHTRSNLQRVQYGWENDGLVRLYWPALDRLRTTEPQRSQLLEHIDAIQFEFQDIDLNWHPTWPPINTQLSPNQNANQASIAWPRAIQFRIDHQSYGEFTRTIALPPLPQPIEQHFGDPGDPGDGDGNPLTIDGSG